MKALVVSVEPETRTSEDGAADHVITAEQLEPLLAGRTADALLIRTLPNNEEKKHLNYSSTNPAYFEPEIVQLLDALGVKHLLVDLPSVDREIDGGVLAFHHAFWNVPEQPRFDRTITEFIFVPDKAEDGFYLLNLETAPFVNDATPSRPVIYPLHRNEEDH